jgi:hypothetical protein
MGNTIGVNTCAAFAGSDNLAVVTVEFAMPETCAVSWSGQAALEPAVHPSPQLERACSQQPSCPDGRHLGTGG